jgi:hypothetical protein
MHETVKIDGKAHLIRDVESHAVINSSFEEINLYNMRKKSAQDKELEFKKQKEEIDSLKEDMREIKVMLQALLKR